MDLGATPAADACGSSCCPRCGRRSSPPGLLTFALSFDDFVLSFFTTGESPQPLPVRIWSAIRFGVTPTINAIGTLMLTISVLAIGLAIWLPQARGPQGERDRRAAGEGGQHERGGALRGRDEALRRGDGGRRPQPHDRSGRVLLAARAVGLRQDDDAADGRGLRAADRGRGVPRGRAGRDRAAVQAQRQHGVPELRAVRAPRRRRATSPSGSSAARSRRPEIETRVAEALELVQLRGRETRAPERALGRPAPARRARPRARQPARGAAARRAARRARPQAAQADAGGAQGDPARGRHHVPLRHPRPGGGAGDVRPHRGHGRRRGRAVRDARGGLRAARRSRSWRASSASRT